jgi:hypothetical protein
MEDSTPAAATIRQRLQDYEFTDEQEMTLTLELLKRIEGDITELKAAKTRDGFSLYVVWGGIAGIFYIVLAELNKIKDVSFSKTAVIFFTILLLSKILWAIYQLIGIDLTAKKQHKPGRFFWSSDFFFELRATGIFQGIIFLLSIIFVFMLPVPLWVAVSTAISFLLYTLIIGFIFIVSFRKEAFRPNNANKIIALGMPALFLVSTVISLIGLISQMEKPIGPETQPFLLAGLLFALVFFIHTLIELTTPSLLLEKLQTLRNDIVFLRANLEDAWTRYEIYIDGNEITEELRNDMDEIVRCFNTLDFHQAKKGEFLLAILEEIMKLEKKRKLVEADFTDLYALKSQFFAHNEEILKIYDYLNPRLLDLSEQIHKISRATQEWQKADKLHEYILARNASVGELDKKITEGGSEVDEKIKELQTKALAK